MECCDELVSFFLCYQGVPAGIQQFQPSFQIFQPDPPFLSDRHFGGNGVLHLKFNGFLPLAGLNISQYFGFAEGYYTKPLYSIDQASSPGKPANTRFKASNVFSRSTWAAA